MALKRVVGQMLEKLSIGLRLYQVYSLCKPATGHCWYFFLSQCSAWLYSSNWIQDTKFMGLFGYIGIIVISHLLVPNYPHASKQVDNFELKWIIPSKIFSPPRSHNEANFV